MHEFSFPGSKGRVVMKGQSDDEAAAEEERVSIDVFFRTCKWIRYTYDFGDDWRHKLVIEKEAADYTARVAMVIKYKGDSFEEDSDGVRGNQGGRIPFDMEQVNRELLDMSFSVQEESEEGRQLLNLIQMENAWKDLGKKGREAIRDLAQIIRDKLVQERSKGPRYKADSEMHRKVQRWVNFCEYGEQPEELLKNVSQRSSRELLGDMPLKGIQEYCKYIGIKPVNMEDISLCAQAVWEELERHPEYLAYIFYWEELKMLMKLLHAPNGICSEVPDQDVVTKALALGFFDLTEERVNHNRYLVLRQTSEAKELMDRYTQAEWKRISKKYRQQIANCNQLINLYTMMELEAFCQKYQEYYDRSASREDILRSIYLGGTFCKELMTADTQEGISYVAENPVDMNCVLFAQRDLGVEVDYRAFSTQERRMSSYGYGDLYPIWGECYEYVTREYCMENEEAEEWLQPLFYAVKSGRGADRLWEQIQDDLALNDLDSYVSFWNYFLGACLTTGIPQFKGYSREEYGKIAGKKLEELGIYENLKPVKKITKYTHLYEMPLEIQMCIYESASGVESKRDAGKLEMLLQEMENGNYELEFLLCGAYLYNRDYKKAERYLRNIQKAYPEDKQIKTILKNIQMVTQPAEDEEFTIWDMMNGKQLKSDVETYRRIQPKIGRNDPCPCGSGKKYKKCCGRQDM